MAEMTWNAMLAEVQPEVIGCPVPMVLNALQNSAIEFLRTTRLLTTDLSAINLVAAQAKYTLTAPANFALVGAESVVADGQPLDPITPTQAAELYGTDWATLTGDPAAFVQVQPYEIYLAPAPSASVTAGLEVTAAVAPVKTATGLEQWIAEAYLEAIAAGAKVRLMRMPKVAWANPDMALYYDGVLKTGLAHALSTKSAGTGRARTRTRTYSR